jgi:hypothetical protein
MEYAGNGLNMLTWSRDGAIYIPLRYGLYRFDGTSMMAVGPEGVSVPWDPTFGVDPSLFRGRFMAPPPGWGGIGLPYERAGVVSALVGTGNWLFAAIDGGTSAVSSIIAYNGLGGWHELYRGEAAGTRIRALGFETIHSPPRLWFGYGNETYYLQLPDYSDNPSGWTGFEYNATGELITSWFGGQLAEVVKDLHEVVIRSEDLSSSQTISVYYEVDQSGSWTYLGQVSGGPRAALEFGSSGFAKKTLTSGSTTTTIELASGSDTTDMVVGDWCRINLEVVQVESITDSNTFVLEKPLATAPLTDDVVYPSHPAGYEFRFKLVFATTSNSASPKLKAMYVRYQNNITDRYVHQLQVRVSDQMKDLNGNPYAYSAAALRLQLDDYARRDTPFILEDPDGNEHTVKVSAGGDGGYARKSKSVPTPFYQSIYSLNLVEVA